MIDLTVSIVNTDNRPLLEPLLESILAHTQRISYKIYVVDNASTDGSAEMVRAKFPQVHLLRNEQREGFSSNNNKVLRRGQGRYLILLNEDMLLVNDALDHMVAFMDEHPEAGAVGCKLLNADGTIQRSCWRGYPSPLSCFVGMFWLRKFLLPTKLVQRFEIPPSQLNRLLEVDHLLGACIMVRREVVNQVGLLDDSLVLYFEDTDWCHRIKKAGWQIYWIPNAEVIHYGQQTARRDAARATIEWFRSYCQYYRKHHPHSLKLVLLKTVIVIGSLVNIGLRSVLVLLGIDGEYSKGMIRGFLETIRQVHTY